MTRFFLGLAALATIVLNAQPARALPLTSKNWNQPLEIHTFSMSPADAQVQEIFPVDAIVGMSNCSASLVKFKGVSEDSAAIVLTNGHCTGGLQAGDMFIKPGQVHNHTKRNFFMSLMNKNAQQVAPIVATEIIYATMTESDFGLLKLNVTYAQLRTIAKGIEPLVVSDLHPQAGMKIQIPSGYWKRTYSCTIDRFVNEMNEGGYIWHDSIRYSATGCNVIGGTSGSPIVSVETGEVIGINNTTNEDGQSCTLNNPCEKAKDGSILVDKGASYGQQTYVLYNCLDSKGQFDINLKTCALPKPKK